MVIVNYHCCSNQQSSVVTRFRQAAVHRSDLVMGGLGTSLMVVPSRSPESRVPLAPVAAAEGDEGCQRGQQCGESRGSTRVATDAARAAQRLFVELCKPYVTPSKYIAAHRTVMSLDARLAKTQTRTKAAETPKPTRSFRCSFTPPR